MSYSLSRVALVLGLACCAVAGLTAAGDQALADGRNNPRSLAVRFQRSISTTGRDPNLIEDADPVLRVPARESEALDEGRRLVGRRSRRVTSPGGIESSSWEDWFIAFWLGDRGNDQGSAGAQ